MMRRLISYIKCGFLFPLVLTVAMFSLHPNLPYALAADESGASGATSDSESATGSSKGIILNMVDTDITTLIKTIGQMTGKTFLIDSNVKGKVNIVSNESIPVEKAYSMFESILEINGFALVPSENGIKVVPAAEARTKNIDTRTKSENLVPIKSPEDSFITQIVSLKYAGAKNVKTLLTPLVSKNSVIQPYEDTNSLIIFDTESNIQRLIKILKVIDVPGSGRKISFHPLLYADAETMTQKLTTLFKTSMSEEKDVSQKTILFVADERTNAVIYVASEEDSERIEELIGLLDKDIPKGKGKIQVKRLMNADAEELAEVLQNLSKSVTSNSSKDDSNEAVFTSSDINITADKATNSLIIMADSADYAILEEIIDNLDIPRSMVYIQAVIMEVSVDKAFELGVEWSALTDTTIDGESSVWGGGFNNSDSGFSATDLLYSTGGTLGVISGTVDITTTSGTVTIPSIGALITALQTNEDVSILSKPSLTTQDNKEASIVIGKNVPYQTRTSTSDNDTYNSYDYKDVGLTLKITPHISQDRNVRLDIYMELTALPGASDDVTTTPTTRKREVTTTVNVNDQETLVIGGLIDDTSSKNVSKVPLLGSIPILGRLFRYDSNSSSKTNLYIFICPRVVQNQSEASQLTSEIEKALPDGKAGEVKLYTPPISEENQTIPHSTELAD